MTVITPSEEILLTQNQQLRNEAIEKAYYNIVKGCRQLLTAFDTIKYRMNVTIDHRKSGKDTHLIHEYLCYFHNITLSNNRFGCYTIFISYDEDALSRFGDKMFVRMLRIVFQYTAIEATGINIENSIRIDKCATDIQPFFINRLLTRGNSYVTITAEEQVPS